MSTQLSSINMDITQPMKMKADVTLNSFTLMTGANGTGKTFFLVNAFCLGMITHLRGNPQAVEAAQFIYDKSFDNQNINGTIIGKYTSGDVEVGFDNGKITTLIITAQNVPPVKFISSHMRTFDDMLMYLKVRKMAPAQTQEAIMEHMLEFQKLYDVVYVEGLIQKCPFTVSAQVLKTLQGSYQFEEDIRELCVDLHKGFYVKIGDEKEIKFITTFGKGHQAVFNMMLGAQP